MELPQNIIVVGDYSASELESGRKYNSLNLALLDSNSGDIIMCYLPVQNYTVVEGVDVIFVKRGTEFNLLEASGLDDGMNIYKTTIASVELFIGRPAEFDQYVVRLSQDGTDDPVILQTYRNTTGKTLTSVDYVSTGHYKFVFSTALASEIQGIEFISRTFYSTTGDDMGKIRFLEDESTTTEIHFSCTDMNDVLTDSLLNYQLVTILVL